MDPLKPYFDAATAEADRPWSAETREAVWREVEARAARHRQRRRFVAGALAVAAAVALVLVGVRIGDRDASGPVAAAPRRVSPEPAQRRALPSPDAAEPHRAPAVVAVEEDSVEPLSPESRFELARAEGRDATTVSLRAGGVRCVVVHRESRRFVVVADDVRVEDRGTRFDVELVGQTVAVSVREGRVDVIAGGRVSPLAAGERGAFPRWNARPPAPRAAVSVDAMLAEVDARMARGDDEGAISLLRDVTRDHRQHPRAQAAAMRLGRLLREEGRPLEAARAFEDARVIAPRGPHAEDAVFQEVTALLDGRRRDLAA